MERRKPIYAEPGPGPAHNMLSNILAPLTGKGNQFGEGMGTKTASSFPTSANFGTMATKTMKVSALGATGTPADLGTEDDEESKKLMNKGKHQNLLALDKWSTEKLLVVQQHYRLVIPDGVLMDKGALVVTGRPVPGGHSETHFEFLHDAIMHCPEGGVVAVSAGTHSIGSRSVMIDKRLKLMGVRNPDSVPDPNLLVPKIPDAERLKHPDYTKCDLEYLSDKARLMSDYGVPILQVTASGVQIEGLTMVQRLAYRSNNAENLRGMQALCALEVSNGSATFRECHVSSDAGIGVKVVSCASPSFFKCRFSFSKQEGIFFGDGATGLVEDSQLFSCTGANLHIETGADPVIHRCRIYESWSCGVRVTDKGKGLLIENQIFSCVSANVRIDDEAAPILKKNEIHGGRVEGVSVMSNGLGRLEHNNIHSNNASGVVILSGGDPTMVENTVHRNREHGVLVTGDGYGVLEKNHVFQNVLAGVYIDDSSNPAVRRNKISNGLGTGITVADKGEGKIEDNEIFLNKTAGLEVRDGGNPEVRVNRIYEGLGVGIRVGINGLGRYVDNEIFRNSHAGVVLEEGADPVFEGNAIFEGETDGVNILVYAAGTFVRNKIQKNALVGVVITSHANPLFQNNLIAENLRFGVQVSKLGRGVLEGNEIRDNAEAGVRIEQDASPLVQKDNRIHAGRAEGVLITMNGGGIVRGNRVYGNVLAGIKVESSNPLIRKNLVYSGKSIGIHVAEHACPRVERNDIFSNMGPAVVVEGGADPLVKKNLVHDGRADAVVIEEGGKGTIEDNRIFMNANVGVKVMGGGCPEVLGNEINNGNGVGVYLLAGARGRFERNVIGANYGEQLRVEGNPEGANNRHLNFVNNDINWRTQPSLRRPSLQHIVREQADPSFIHQPEPPPPPSRGSTPSTRGSTPSIRLRDEARAARQATSGTDGRAGSPLSSPMQTQTLKAVTSQRNAKAAVSVRWTDEDDEVWAARGQQRS